MRSAGRCSIEFFETGPDEVPESAPCNYGLMSAATSLSLKIGGDTEFLPYSCFF